MSRMRYSSTYSSSGPSGGGGSGGSHHDRHHQYDRYNPHRDGDGDNVNDDDNLPRCPCESPHKQVFTVSHLLIVHSEDLERLLAWLPMADGDVHANPGKFFEEFWPTWTQECVLKQIEGPKNDHGFAFEISAPGFPVRVRGNNSQIRQAQATAVLHFMLALVSGQHDTSRLPVDVQERLATLPRKRPAVPNWISGDLHEVKVQDEETEYSREYISRKHPRLVTQFAEMQMDPTNHFSSPRKILDELDIDFPYFTYRKLRSGFWRAYAIHRKVTVCGDALYVADARAVAILHLLVLAARGLIDSNLDSKRTYDSCMRPDPGFRNRSKGIDQYKPGEGQPQHQNQHPDPQTRHRSRSRSRSPPPPARHSRPSTAASHSESTRPSARGRGRSRSRSPPPPAKHAQARHDRHSRSPWRRRRSGSRSTSRQREHERVRERKRSPERRRSVSPADNKRRRRTSASSESKSGSRRRSVTEPAKPISVKPEPAAVAAPSEELSQAQVPTPLSNTTPSSMTGSPITLPGTAPAAIAALPFAVSAVPNYSTPEAALAALVALQRQVEQLTSSVSQMLQLVQPLYTQHQQQMYQVRQFQHQQAMLASMAAGSPAAGFAMIPQQQQQQQQHQQQSQASTMQQAAAYYGLASPQPQQQGQQGQSPQVHQQQQLAAQYQQQQQQQYLSPQVSQPKSSPGLSQGHHMQQQYRPSSSPIGTPATMAINGVHQQHQQQPMANGPGSGSSGSGSGSGAGASPGNNSLYGRWLNRS